MNGTHDGTLFLQRDASAALIYQKLGVMTNKICWPGQFLTTFSFEGLTHYFGHYVKLFSSLAFLDIFTDDEHNAMYVCTYSLCIEYFPRCI